MRLYTFDNQFIEETDVYPENFTGIIEHTSDGAKEWFVEGKFHRLDGPACEYVILKYWFIDHQRIDCQSNEQFLLLVDIMKLKGLL